jgi:hypothetical protein
MKQWLALALALVLALALAVPALAVEVTWDSMTDGNTVLAKQDAYTPETAQKALDAFQAFQDTAEGSKEEKAAYDAFKAAIKGLEFKAHSFTDAPSSWYDEALNYVGVTGKMNGVGSGRFDPQGTMTRAMAVTILWRMNGEPAAQAPASFSDVPAGQWYTDAVAWAVEQKITTGKSATVFDPNSPVTREQMAAFFSRMVLALAGVDGDLGLSEAEMRAVLADQYSDAAQISAYALDDVLICLELGIMKGNADGTFAPLANITRAQGAQMLLNYYDFLIEASFREL